MNGPKTVATGLLLAALASGVQADPYGTLFTTAEQRAKLDRGIGNEPNAASGASGGAAQAVKAPRPFELNGTLIGNYGEKEVWINGQPELHNGNRKNPRVSLVKNGSVRFRPSAAATPRLMKPGQIYDPQTGTVSEAYQQGIAADETE